MSSRYHYTRALEGVRLAFQAFGQEGQFCLLLFHRNLHSVPAGTENRQRAMYAAAAPGAVRELTFLLSTRNDLEPDLRAAVIGVVDALDREWDFHQGLSDASDRIEALVSASRL